jgi:hypothetical protein
VGKVPPVVPLTANVDVGVKVGLVETSGVGVTLAALAVRSMVPKGVEGVCVAILGSGEPVKARAVPVPKTSTSLMLGVSAMGVSNKLFGSIGVFVEGGGVE